MQIVIVVYTLSSSFISSDASLRVLHSFPTRRSSDLAREESVHMAVFPARADLEAMRDPELVQRWNTLATVRERVDRKSTRLNSSHVAISYAVFCLKKKKRTASSMR